MTLETTKQAIPVPAQEKEKKDKGLKKNDKKAEAIEELVCHCPTKDFDEKLPLLEAKSLILNLFLGHSLSPKKTSN
jgi:hypothetical protein